MGRKKSRKSRTSNKSMNSVSKSIKRMMRADTKADNMRTMLNKLDAWKKGIKTLYYVRTESVLRGDIADAAMSEDCLACDG